MLGGRSSDEWVAEYQPEPPAPDQPPLSHLRHPADRGVAGAVCRRVVRRGLLARAATLFVLGWVLQFVGHAVEGKPPEFFKDPRFLLVGLRWWFAKMRGKALATNSGR